MGDVWSMPLIYASRGAILLADTAECSSLILLGKQSSQTCASGYNWWVRPWKINKQHTRTHLRLWHNEDSEVTFDKYLWWHKTQDRNKITFLTTKTCKQTNKFTIVIIGQGVGVNYERVCFSRKKNSMLGHECRPHAVPAYSPTCILAVKCWPREWWFMMSSVVVHYRWHRPRNFASTVDQVWTAVSGCKPTDKAMKCQQRTGTWRRLDCITNLCE